jgi:branched-chain amino acid transport system substrate-binding protein
MVADGVVFVVGHACSHAAIAASKAYEEASILYMAASATNPKLTDEGGPNVFRLRGRDDQVATLAADFLAKEWGNEPIAIIHDGRTSGQYLAETVRQRLNEHGIEEATYVEVSPGQLDFSALIVKFQNAGIGIVFFGGYPNEAGLFIRQARDHGADFPLVGGDALADEEFGLIAGAAAERSLVIDPPSPKNAEARDQFVARHREKCPTLPAEPSFTSPTNYVAFKVWAEAVRIAGSFDAAAVAEVLRTNTFDTMFGPLCCAAACFALACRRSERRRRLPADRHAVVAKHGVDRYHREPACHGLGDDQPVPGIAMRTGQLARGQRVREGQGVDRDARLAQDLRQDAGEVAG